RRYLGIFTKKMGYADKLTQSIIKDHMVSHYKKVYSAKGESHGRNTYVIMYDNDQIRKDLARKGGRPQSAHSFSQRNTRASCSSAQVGNQSTATNYDDSPYLCSTNSVVSSTGLSTSFHVKDIVYPSCKVTQNHSHHARPASQIQYRNPEAVLQRKQSVCSLAPSGDQSCYKIFQDPVQKTYSGDLLQKHSQRFTPDKPFTPKTLKSDKSSYLSKYRYYRAPQKKPTQDRTHMRRYTSNLSESQIIAVAISSSSLSPDGGTSPIMKSVSAEEEELMYLEFISAVTEDMLSRGHISDRVLDRVIMRHIDMNRHQLDEGKMRHLLEVLRKDFEEPISISNSSTEPENKEDDLFDTLLPHLESVEKQIPQTKEDNDIFPYASLIKYDSPGYTDAISGFTPLSSPKRAASLMTTEEKNEEGDIQEKCTGSPWFHENLTNNTGIIEEDSHQNQTGLTITSIEVSSEHHEKTTETSDEGFQQDQVEASYERQSTELEDLGRSLSVSLHVSNNTNCKNMETASEQHTNTVASVSDDEF
uniref:Spermatogenesis associated 7 n=1 Tax=Mastacembelus armatus TaxID=205130 RepID=A0A3Q3LGI8_9TELE